MSDLVQIARHTVRCDRVPIGADPVFELDLGPHQSIVSFWTHVVSRPQRKTEDHVAVVWVTTRRRDDLRAIINEGDCSDAYAVASARLLAAVNGEAATVETTEDAAIVLFELIEHLPFVTGAAVSGDEDDSGPFVTLTIGLVLSGSHVSPKEQT